MLEFGNKVYLSSEYEVAPLYKQMLLRDFGSDIELSDFVRAEDAARQINSWVSNVTHYRITALLTPGKYPRI